MNKQIIFFIIPLYYLFESEASNNHIFELPDYEYYVDRYIENKPSLREIFLERKNQRRAKEMRIQLLNKLSSKDTVYLNGIAHIVVDERLESWNKINEIEFDLRGLLAAIGVSYVYKRDHFWRTWKKVVYPNNLAKIVCYKCNNAINTTYKKCPGFWTIEEDTPPCPVDLFSVISPVHVCGAKFTQIYNYTDACPVVIKFADIVSSCDNPIKTTYQITRLFKKSKGLPETICGKRDYCEISTYYRIYKDFIFFRVVNSSNDIIYSRIMKYGNKNYVCIKNCGSTDSKSNNVTDDKPLTFSLLKKRVSKRENELSIFNFHNTKPRKKVIKKYKVSKKEAGKIKNIFETSNEETLKRTIFSLQEQLKRIKAKYLPMLITPTTESVCSKLRRKTATEDYEINDID
ncbi:unnamed protein product [Chilo suppressalis]|uniref:Uncharacterized protein n=1 Tax=Chilo suppressalis TaxID=168631 RepID=A0ABN8EBA5_CHISP|nr:unnamed protein product [Chilo suppressalis]